MISQMKQIYIGGAYSADNALEREYNVRRAETLAIDLIRYSVTANCLVSVIVPHTMARFWHGVLSESVFIDIGLRQLASCDAMLVVREGLSKSRGTQGELRFAKSLNIPAFWTIDNVLDWAAGKMSAERFKDVTL